MNRSVAYKVFVQQNEGGFTAVVPELPGCFSQGRTEKQALANACEAVALYLQPVADARSADSGALSAAIAPLDDLLRGLRPQGWVPVHVRGRHVRLHNRIGDAILIMTIPLVADLLDSTLFEIMKRATVDAEDVKRRVWGPQGRDKIQALTDGGRMRAIGNRVVLRPEEETFSEFLVWLLWRLLNPRWLREQMQVAASQQHTIAKWYLAYQKWRETGKCPENEADGGWRIALSGHAQCLLSLAYDVYQLLHSGNWSGKVFRRLRAYDKFQGARYEIAVAAILSRLGYRLTYPKGGIGVPHPEFTARHPTTGSEIAIEAKSRHRAGVLNEPGSRQATGPTSSEIKTLFAEALRQCPAELPAAIFIDLNVPPPQAGASRKWFEELAERFKGEIGTCGPGKRDSFNVLFLTNFPYHWVGSGPAPSTQRGCVISFQPRLPFPKDLIAEMYEAIANYGVIPDERF